MKLLYLIGVIALLSPRLPAAPEYGALPLVFEANIGQLDPEVRFLARSRDVTLALTSDGALVRRGTSLVRMRMDGATRGASPRGRHLQAGRAHYFIGAPAQWRTGIPLYSEVEFTNIYPGVDLVFRGGSGEIEYDFLLAPGANPDGIRLCFDGIDGLELADGDLVLRTGKEELRHHRPRVYQQVDGRAVAIEGRFRLFGQKSAGFAVAHYDHGRPLIVDPILSYSTRVGGGGDDRGWAIAVDRSGSAYVTGETWAVDFPGAKVGSGDTGGQDVYVTKLNAAGTGIAYTAMLGGSSRDSARAIAVDASGYAYVTGVTYSRDFPTTTGAYRTVSAGMEDAFLFKLSATGDSLVYSTRLGGAGSDFASGIAIDASGNAYVTGYTSSLGFPTTIGSVQRTNRGGYDAFAAKLNATGSALIWSTYLGGTGLDIGNAIAVDGAGGTYVAGVTQSANFPVRNPYKGTLSGSQDAFVARLSPAGDTLSYATFLGGANRDSAYGIAVDEAGEAYVTGSTYSRDFPVTSGAFQTMNRGGYDAFVTKLNASGSSLLYATYLGGSGSEQAAAIAIDGAGRAYVAGNTDSADFPLQGAVQGAFGGTRDAFLGALNETGATLYESTYLGGAGDDQATGIAVDSSGAAYVAGLTLSADFPATVGVWRPNPIGSIDAFVAKLASPPPTVALSVSPASGTGMSQTFTFAASDPGGASNIATLYILVNSSSSAANACKVAFDRPSHLMWLIADDGATWPGGVFVGSSSTVSNSQCSIDVGGSSVSEVGNVLMLSLKMAFKTAFGGPRELYMLAVNQYGLETGWRTVGSWTVEGAPPPSMSVSVSPASGSGTSQSFSFAATDPKGAADVATVYILINSSLNSANACKIAFDGPSGLVWVIADNGTTWPPAGAVGSGAVLSNSQCTVDLSGSSVNKTGTVLTLSLKIAFKQAFTGGREIYMMAVNQAGTDTGWQHTGSWTVSGGFPSAFSVSVTPSSGSGASQIFNFAASHPNGAANVATLYVIINNTLSGASACQIAFDKPSTLLWLIADNGTTWPPGAALGSNSTVSNTQCSIDLANSSASQSGSTVTLKLKLAFKAAFAGVRQIYVQAVDQNGANTGWQQAGSWTVP